MHPSQGIEDLIIKREQMVSQSLVCLDQLRMLAQRESVQQLEDKILLRLHRLEDEIEELLKLFQELGRQAEQAAAGDGQPRQHRHRPKGNARTRRRQFRVGVPV